MTQQKTTKTVEVEYQEFYCRWNAVTIEVEADAKEWEIRQAAIEAGDEGMDQAALDEMGLEYYPYIHSAETIITDVVRPAFTLKDIAIMAARAVGHNTIYNESTTELLQITIYANHYYNTLIDGEGDLLTYAEVMQFDPSCQDLNQKDLDIIKEHVVYGEDLYAPAHTQTTLLADGFEYPLTVQEIALAANAESYRGDTYPGQFDIYPLGSDYRREDITKEEMEGLITEAVYGANEMLARISQLTGKFYDPATEDTVFNLDCALLEYIGGLITRQEVDNLPESKPTL